MDLPFLGDRKLFEQLPQAALLLDLQGLVLAANCKACRLLNSVEQDLLGRHADEATGFSILVGSCPLEEVVRQRTGLSSVEVDGQGAGLPLVVELTPLLDDAGQCIALLESFCEAPVLHEMSTRLQQKQASLQAETVRSRALVNSIADGIYTVDTSMRITSFSRSLERMTGYTEEEVLGELCRNVLQANICDTDCPLGWTLANEQPIQNCRASLGSHTGETIPAFVSSDLLRDSEGHINGCIGIVRDRSEIEKLKKRLGDSPSFSDFVGKSKVMVELFELGDNVASTDATVLIQGESGTGKEIMARAIHYRSERRKHPFIRVNCESIPIRR